MNIASRFKTHYPETYNKIDEYDRQVTGMSITFSGIKYEFSFSELLDNISYALINTDGECLIIFKGADSTHYKFNKEVSSHLINNMDEYNNKEEYENFHWCMLDKAPQEAEEDTNIKCMFIRKEDTINKSS